MFQCGGQAAQETRCAKHDFDLLSAPRRNRIVMRRALHSDYDDASACAYAVVGTRLATREVVSGVMDRNANSVLLFEKAGKIAGLWAMLPLNAGGLEALLTGEMDTEKPDFVHISSVNQTPAAMYIWLVVAPSLVAEGIRHVSVLLRQPMFVRANLYARAASALGGSIILNTGFRALPSSKSGLYRYVRKANLGAQASMAA